MRTAVRWGWKDVFALIGLVLVVFYYTAKEFMPALEGSYSPVVLPAILLQAKTVPDFRWRYQWSAEAVKVRDCGYVLNSIRWYLGVPAKPSQPVHAMFRDKPQKRDLGTLRWDGLEVDGDPEAIRTGSYATVRHKCPWRWWEVESVFYLPPTD